MDPVFGGLPHKVLLRPTRGAVTSGWIAPCPYQIIEPGELHDESIVIIFEEWFSL